MCSLWRRHGTRRHEIKPRPFSRTRTDEATTPTLLYLWVDTCRYTHEREPLGWRAGRRSRTVICSSGFYQQENPGLEGRTTGSWRAIRGSPRVLGAVKRMSLLVTTPKGLLISTSSFLLFERKQHGSDTMHLPGGGGGGCGACGHLMMWRPLLFFW